MRSYFLLFILLMSTSTFAQIEKHAQWSSAVSKKEVKVGETVDLIFTAKVDEDWYLYSSDFDPNLGPVVTELELEKHPSFQVVGKLKPIGAKKKYDDMWGGDITYFVKEGKFIQSVKILKENPVIKGRVTGQTCSDKLGKCVATDYEVTFNQIKVIKEDKSIAPPQAPDNNQGADADVHAPAPKPKLEDLEKAKSDLIRKNGKGEDESLVFLKNYIKKWGAK